MKRACNVSPSDVCFFMALNTDYLGKNGGIDTSPVSTFFISWFPSTSLASALHFILVIIIYSFFPALNFIPVCATIATNSLNCYCAYASLSPHIIITSANIITFIFSSPTSISTSSITSYLNSYIAKIINSCVDNQMIWKIGTWCPNHI